MSSPKSSTAPASASSLVLICANPSVMSVSTALGTPASARPSSKEAGKTRDGAQGANRAGRLGCILGGLQHLADGVCRGSRKLQRTLDLVEIVGRFQLRQGAALCSDSPGRGEAGRHWLQQQAY